MNKYVLLLLISGIWGSQFFFIALVIENVGVITLSAIKAFIGGICLLFLGLFLSKEERKVPRSYYKWYIIIAFFEVVLPFVFIAQGQKSVPSSIAAVLIGMVPIFTILFLPVFFKIKSTRLQITSILFGFAGIVFLSWPTQGIQELSNSIQGNILMILAAMSFGLSLIFMEKLNEGSSVIHMRNVLLIASALLIPMSLLFEQSFKLDIAQSQSIYLAILGIFHAGVVYALFNSLIRQEGALFTSYSNYIVPVIGMILGYFFLQEELSIHQLIGMGIIMMSLVFLDKKIIIKLKRM
ncbi:MULTISPECIES: DMT family transporter [unclassified Bacillus (in: firmicutes)]|uniref:DMT family transporter n=1 Tax=unclassified Bacillus (in: firmicutes) TaxID=185979 RepID=UPI001BE76271|nr:MULTISPECIES: DMT family transporter [unclassified Bacillus (in: firmicutes)]MBT2615893.1 EamA family transporter [Bacillus sp. ISL-78]MBT2630355.1 EamA family transporter [Bacillus sp. ISL-101]MBT2714480.1 EamA family transporter [Bacillus sp. ISL-57]